MPASGKASIQLYRSATAGTRPSSLLQGEIFLNEEDGVLCWPDTDGTVRTTWLDNAQGVPKTITSSPYTVLNTDRWLIFSVATTVTLPAPSAALAGRKLNIKAIAAVAITSASSNVRPLASNTAGTAIVSGTLAAGKWATLVCDGTYWVIMSAN